MTPRSFSSLLDRFSKYRFASISLLLHVMLLVFGGSAVLFHVAIDQDVFTASDDYGGLVGEEGGEEMAPPPDLTEMSPDEMELDVTVPTMSAPAVTDVLTSTNLSSSFAMPALPKSVEMNSSRFAQGMAKKISDGNAKRGLGTLGKGLRTGKIFGREVTATKLGVLIDMSFSTHNEIDAVVGEVQKSFDDALIVLVPGCGMKREKARVITAKEFELELPKVNTKPKKRGTKIFNSYVFMPQLMKKNAQFSRLFDKGARTGLMYVQVPMKTAANESGINATQESFEFLIKQEVDTIYWFADFKDKIEDKFASDVLRRLRTKKIVVHQHVFANPNPDKKYMVFAEETKGEVINKSSGSKGKKKAKK